MRLTCPNCGAQYEVPDEVIPFDGRDVQCSNCGDTWFQAHPDNPDTTAETEEMADPSAPEPGPEPEQVQQAPVEPAPQQSDQKKPDLEPEVTDILREEAEREAGLRATQAPDPLESQPDLGLDDLPGDEVSQRAKEASDRMARMRGEPAPAPEPAGDSGSRRELLPDIEEINSSLRASDDQASPHTAVGPVRAESQQKKRGGFARGFALVVLIGVIMAVVYVNAPKISKAVPQVDPMLNSYVTMIDQARVWLDTRLGEFIAKPEE